MVTNILYRAAADIWADNFLREAGRAVGNWLFTGDDGFARGRAAQGKYISEQRRKLDILASKAPNDTYNERMFNALKDGIRRAGGYDGVDWALGIPLSGNGSDNRTIYGPATSEAQLYRKLFLGDVEDLFVTSADAAARNGGVAEIKDAIADSFDLGVADKKMDKVRAGMLHYLGRKRLLRRRADGPGIAQRHVNEEVEDAFAELKDAYLALERSGVEGEFSLGPIEAVRKAAERMEMLSDIPVYDSVGMGTEETVRALGRIEIAKGTVAKRTIQYGMTLADAFAKRMPIEELLKQGVRETWAKLGKNLDYLAQVTGDADFRKNVIDVFNGYTGFISDRLDREKAAEVREEQQATTATN